MVWGGSSEESSGKAANSLNLKGMDTKIILTDGTKK